MPIRDTSPPKKSDPPGPAAEVDAGSVSGGFDCIEDLDHECTTRLVTDSEPACTTSIDADDNFAHEPTP